MAIIRNQPYPMLIAYRNPEDIETALQTAGVAEEVKKRGEGVISVAKAITQLEQVGNLLELAYAGSYGFSCSVEITDMMGEYHDLIKSSNDAASAFVEASLKALNFHMEALESAEKGDIENVGIVLSQCEALAANMVIESEKLVKQSTALKQRSVAALRLATEDNNFSIDQRTKMQQSINETLKKEKVLDKHKEDLIRDLERELEDEKRANQVASRAQKISDVTAVISVFVEPIVTLVSPLRALSSSIKGAIKKDKKDPAETSYGLFEKAIEETGKLTESLEEARIQLVSAKTRLGLENNEDKKKLLLVEIAALETKIQIKENALKQQELNFKELQKTFQHQAENAQQRASRIMERRVELQQKLRQANMDIAEVVSGIEHLKVEKDNLGVAVASIQVSMQMLGKITMIFRDTCRFWEGVRKKCQNLESSDVKRVMQRQDQQAIIRAIKNSGLDWLSLGKNTNTAFIAMQKIDEDFDRVMGNLPNEAEAARLIQGTVQKVLKGLAEEDKRLAISE